MPRFPTGDRGNLAAVRTSTRVTEDDPFVPSDHPCHSRRPGGIHQLWNRLVTSHPGHRALYRGVEPLAVAKARVTREVAGARERWAMASNQPISPAIARLEESISGLLSRSAGASAVLDALDEATGTYRIVLTGRLARRTRAGDPR